MADLEHFAGLGLEGGVDLVCGFLESLTIQPPGGFHTVMKTTVFWVEVTLALAITASCWICVMRGMTSHPRYIAVSAIPARPHLPPVRKPIRLCSRQPAPDLLESTA